MMMVRCSFLFMSTALPALLVDGFSTLSNQSQHSNAHVLSPINVKPFGTRNGDGCYPIGGGGVSWQPERRYGKDTSLFLSDTPLQPDEELRTKDPIKFLWMEVENMDINAIVNTGVIVLVVLSVLNNIASVDSSIMRGWSPEEMAVRIPVDNWLSYNSILERSPVQTKAITSATVYTIGDFIAQRTEGTDMGKLDRMRLLRSLLAGLIGHGPLSHLWYNWSEEVFDNVLHLNDLWWGFVPKVAIDQATWGPFWNNTYILLLGLMKFDSPENIFNEMKRTTIPLIVSGLKLWPLAHCVTYGLVPIENRLLWVDIVEILWVTILATAAAEGAEGGHGAPAVVEDNTNEVEQ